MSPSYVPLQAALAEQGIAAALLLKPQNVFYLAGYASVCSGVLLPAQGEPLFCTLWLDRAEAKEACLLPRLQTYVYPKQSLVGRLADLLQKELGIPGRLGVEKDFMQVRHYEMLQERFPACEMVSISPLIDRFRAVKDPQEIAKIKQASAIADQAMAAALAAVRPGVREIEVAAEAEYMIRKQGSLGTTFSTFVASGPRTMLAHPHASAKLIEPGEAVVIDLGPTFQGYSADLCRTAFAGEPTPQQVERLQVVMEAQSAARERLGDGAQAGAVYQAAFEVFQRHGLGRDLPEDLGYGVGLRQSEFHPIIEKHSQTVLRANMVIALLHTTAFSKGLGGLRVEDTFLVTQNGAQRLTRHQQELYR